MQISLRLQKSFNFHTFLFAQHSVSVSKRKQNLNLILAHSRTLTNSELIQDLFSKGARRDYRYVRIHELLTTVHTSSSLEYVAHFTFYKYTIVITELKPYHESNLIEVSFSDSL